MRVELGFKVSGNVFGAGPSVLNLDFLARSVGASQGFEGNVKE